MYKYVQIARLKQQVKELEDNTSKTRQLIYDLADRVFWWSLEVEQEKDIQVLYEARKLGWEPNRALRAK